MARAIVFKRANASLGRPPGMTKDQCRVLPVWTNGKMCVSCWKLTDEEKDQIIETGLLYVGVLSGAPTQPPVKIWGTDPFAPPFCDKCNHHHPLGIVTVQCRSCHVPFSIDGCIHNEDCGLGEFTCPTCDQMREELDDGS